MDVEQPGFGLFHAPVPRALVPALLRTRSRCRPNRLAEPVAYHLSRKGSPVQHLRRFLRNEHGQDLIEYAFLAIFMSLVAALALTTLGAGLNAHFSNVATQVSSGS